VDEQGKGKPMIAIRFDKCDELSAKDRGSPVGRGFSNELASVADNGAVHGENPAIDRKPPGE